MTYKNSVTGAIIETASVLGGVWESVDSHTKPVKKDVVDEKKPVEAKSRKKV